MCRAFADFKIKIEPETKSMICLYTPPAAFLTQTVCLDDTTVKFEIWDTAGQERYHSLAPMYYRGAQAAIVVYDITNTVSDSCWSRVELVPECCQHSAVILTEVDYSNPQQRTGLCSRN